MRFRMFLTGRQKQSKLLAAQLLTASSCPALCSRWGCKSGDTPPPNNRVTHRAADAASVGALVAGIAQLEHIHLPAVEAVGVHIAQRALALRMRENEHVCVSVAWVHPRFWRQWGCT